MDEQQEQQNEQMQKKTNGNLFKIGVGLIVVLGLITFFTTRTDKEPENINQNNLNQNMENYTTAKITTNLGDIEIEFFGEQSPKTVENFIKLASSDFYNNIKFHRVIKGFMIQTGDPLTKEENEMLYGTGGPGYQFEDEISDIPLVEGTVAMANAGPNTNGSQFFIITAPETPWLQGLHTAFAKVTKGLDIAHKIENVKTNERDLPIEPVVIEKIELK